MGAGEEGAPVFFRGTPYRSTRQQMSVRMRVRYKDVLATMHISYRRQVGSRVQDFSQKRVPRCPNADAQGVCTLF